MDPITDRGIRSLSLGRDPPPLPPVPYPGSFSRRPAGSDSHPNSSSATAKKKLGSSPTEVAISPGTRLCVPSLGRHGRQGGGIGHRSGSAGGEAGGGGDGVASLARCCWRSCRVRVLERVFRRVKMVKAVYSWMDLVQDQTLVSRPGLCMGSRRRVCNGTRQERSM